MKKSPKVKKALKQLKGKVKELRDGMKKSKKKGKGVKKQKAKIKKLKLRLKGLKKGKVSKAKKQQKKRA